MSNPKSERDDADATRSPRASGGEGVVEEPAGEAPKKRKSAAGSKKKAASSSTKTGASHKRAAAASKKAAASGEKGASQPEENGNASKTRKQPVRSTTAESSAESPVGVPQPNARSRQHPVNVPVGRMSDGGADPAPPGLRPPARPSPWTRAPWGAPPNSGLTRTDLRHYARILREQRRAIVVTFVAVIGFVAIVTLLQDPVYRASGSIEIRPPASASTEDAPSSVSEQYLETQYEILASAGLARGIVERLELTGDEAFVRETGLAGKTFADSAQLQSAAVDGFLDRLTINPIRGSALVRIHFDAGDPELAARSVQSVIEEYVRSRIAAADATVANLAKQVETARGRLAQAEGQLQEYARENDLVIGATEELLQSRLRTLEEEVTAAEAEAFLLQPRRDLARGAGAAILQSPVLESLNVRAAELRAEYARLRTTFTDQYPETMKVKGQLDAINRSIGAERARLADGIAGEYEAAIQRQRLLEGASQEHRAVIEQMTGRLARYRILDRDVQAQQEVYSGLERSRREAEVAAAVAASTVEIAEPPLPPRSPFRPDPIGNLLLGGAIGLLLGIALAFLREHTDDTVRGFDEIRAVSDQPVLALIPSRGSTGHGLNRLAPSPPPLRLRAKTSEASLSEAFRTLRTSVLFDADGPVPSSLLITSAHPGEGKSTTAVNLALSLSLLDRSVLLIDADLRRAAIAREFRITGGGSLTEFLKGKADDWRELLHLDTSSGLHLLRAGSTRINPAELLSKDLMGKLVREAEQEFDHVIIDSPAVLVNVTDTRLLAPLASACVVVARSGTTHLAALERVLAELPNVVGVVLNDLDSDRFAEYYSEYPGRGDEVEPELPPDYAVIPVVSDQERSRPRGDPRFPPDPERTRRLRFGHWQNSMVDRRMDSPEPPGLVVETIEPDVDADLAVEADPAPRGENGGAGPPASEHPYGPIERFRAEKYGADPARSRSAPEASA